MAHEMLQRGVGFRRQVPIQVEYKGVRLECGYRIDLLVADEVIVESVAIPFHLP